LEIYYYVLTSQAALKAFQAVKTMSALVQQYQKAVKDISTQHSMGLFWVPEHSGVRGNEIADKLARDGTVMLDHSRPWGAPGRI
jgi:ribonuclease HI